MATLPLLLFPKLVDVKREGLPNSNPPRPMVPNAEKQHVRLGRKFADLSRAIDAETLEAQSSVAGEDPDLVLVIETIGAVEDFVSTANRIPGLEWLFGQIANDIAPDEDFHYEDEPEKTLSGRLFLLSTTRGALAEILKIWELYKRDSRGDLGDGLNSWKAIFPLIRDMRFWGPSDRAGEDIRRLWKERADIGEGPLQFEIEAWCYRSAEKNVAAEGELRGLVGALGGRMLSVCLIPEIGYHGFLVEMEAAALNQLLSENPPELILSKRVMLFRPRGQAVASRTNVEEQAESRPVDAFPEPTDVLDELPLIAILDGLPLENHARLINRLVVDDPDDWASSYTVSERRHGTSVASLIAWGELNENAIPLARKIYVRPIMRPDETHPGPVRPESTPNDRLLIDLVHSAVKRIFDGDGNLPPAASFVKVINLSLGDAYRLFDGTSISAWARLVDWLSFKYKVLFIISAGNNSDDLVLRTPRESLSGLSRDEASRLATQALVSDDMHRRLFSPAESINAITVGALHDDRSAPAQIPNRHILFMDAGLAPYSCIGPGFRRSIKPDVLFPGGRVRYTEQYATPSTETAVKGNWESPSSPGLAAACPPTQSGATEFVRGTSFAAALASRAAARAYSVVESLRAQSPEELPAEYDTVLLKCLLVHGAAWGNSHEQLRDAKDQMSRNQHSRLTSRYAGYGVSDIERALTCTEQRATLVGVGSLRNEKAAEFKVRVPMSLHALPRKRRLTITLAWLSPINPHHSRYRTARLWVNPPVDLLGLARINSDYRQVRNGTVQHEVLEGDQAMALVPEQELVFTVNCVQDASRIFVPIEFALCVTLEVAEDLRLPLYQEMQAAIATRAQVAV